MAKKDLIAYMAGKEVVAKNEIMALFGGMYELPPYEKLAESYIGAKISQSLSSMRDEDGRRLILAKRGKGGTHYVNVPLSKSLPDLKHIRQRIWKDIAGQGASLDKVNLRIDDIEAGLPEGGSGTLDNYAPENEMPFIQ